MRQRYLVTYDIGDAKRLRKVFKLMKGFGAHLQFSVFRCDLSRMQVAQLKMDLLAVVDCEADQVLIIDVGPLEGRGGEVFDSVGRPYVEDERADVL